MVKLNLVLLTACHYCDSWLDSSQNYSIFKRILLYLFRVECRKARLLVDFNDEHMSDDNSLIDAYTRLNRAVEELERSVATRMEREEVLGDAEAEVQRMGADRTRLAEALDDAQDRANKLDHVNREVSRRLVDAMESIRAVIERKQEV